MNATKTEAVQTRWSELVAKHNKGQSDYDLSTALKEAIIAVRQNGKAASITHTITIEPANDDATTVIISDAIRSKLPQKPRKRIHKFTTEQGGLTDSDPNQQQLPGYEG